MPGAYYNEIDPFAAATLRNLIVAGHIAPGFVDERSIEDVRPDELAGYTQCHFFAGVGVWSYALRRAGWDDARPVWTGSCPCQPFSAAGKGAGFADERHLWPAWQHLIGERRPPAVFGEQVASSDVGPWVDLVHDDMEAMDYAFGAVPFPSAGIGAPHIRDRLYWVADATDQRQHRRRASGASDGRVTARLESERLCDAGFLGDTKRARLALGQRIGRISGGASRADAGQAIERAGIHSCGLADGGGQRWIGREGIQARGIDDGQDARRLQGDHGPFGSGKAGVVSRPASPTNGLWADADWLLCRDGKWRPVEPGTFPLAHGAPARVGRLRAYGNAINAQAAQVFIEAYLAGEA